jgi:hypothetical protein
MESNCEVACNHYFITYPARVGYSVLEKSAPVISIAVFIVGEKEYLAGKR